ncbi:MAG: AAA family ATPase [Gammaproteobacteria bacterium]|nr:AAA family ATPase [Gammaproteobacteria bacterium]
MIKTLFTGNFKAFAETQRIPIRPITMIFGPNSAGKSSFIHSLALASEAERTGRLDVFKTEVGGSAIDLGGFRQYIHRGEAKRRMEWGAELDVSSLQGRLEELLAPVNTLKVVMFTGVALDNEERPLVSAEPAVTGYELFGDDQLLLRMSRRPDGKLRLDRLNHEHLVFREVLKAIVTTATTTNTVTKEDFEGIDDVINVMVPRLSIGVTKLFPEGLTDRRVDNEEQEQATLFPVSKGNRSEDLANAINFFLPKTLDELIMGTSQILAQELKKLQYLGPLRSFPPRHLAFSEHEDANWYAGGGYAWDIVRRDDTVRSAVNEWLGSEVLKTPYELVVRQLVGISDLDPVLEEGLETIIDDGVEIEHEPESEYTGGGAYPILRDSEAEARRLQELIQTSDLKKLKELVLIDRRSNTVVSHRDVGIGITQVLPVLVLAYASTDKLIAMEQPEIHLHPALQAELGDVFINSALGGRGNRFILETHSEHLLLRIMRRMRETDEQMLPEGTKPIHPEDVMVLYVEPDGGRSIVREMPLNARGELVKAWPGGFFEEGLREIF